MNPSMPSNPSYGFLTVRVSTARGAIPLAGAAVSIRDQSGTEGAILHSLVTNGDGVTERVPLPTPAPSASDAPGGPPPYASYRVDVSKRGYLPVTFEEVPVFPSILSVQPAVLVPAAGAGGTLSVAEAEPSL